MVASVEWMSAIFSWIFLDERWFYDSFWSLPGFPRNKHFVTCHISLQPNRKKWTVWTFQNQTSCPIDCLNFYLKKIIANQLHGVSPFWVIKFSVHSQKGWSVDLFGRYTTTFYRILNKFNRNCLWKNWTTWLDLWSQSMFVKSSSIIQGSLQENKVSRLIIFDGICTTLARLAYCVE